MGIIILMEMMASAYPIPSGPTESDSRTGRMVGEFSFVIADSPPFALWKTPNGTIMAMIMMRRRIRTLIEAKTLLRMIPPRREKACEKQAKVAAARAMARIVPVDCISESGEEA